MKVRTGFVSNSSSTSYVIVGVGVTLDDKILKHFGLEPRDKDYNADFTRCLECLGTVLEPFNITVQPTSYDYDQCVIGFDLELKRHHSKSVNQLADEMDEILTALGIKNYSFEPAGIIVGEYDS